MCVVYINHLEADYDNFVTADKKEPPRVPQRVPRCKGCWWRKVKGGMKAVNADATCTP